LSSFLAEVDPSCFIVGQPAECLGESCTVAEGSVHTEISEDLPVNTVREMTDAALRIYGALRCRDLARTDFRVDGQGRMSFLEINR